MVKKRSAGPTLTQRERKSQSLASPALEPGAQNVGEVNVAKPSELTQMPAAPTELFMRWLYGVFKSGLTTDKIIQLTILAFAVNQSYATIYPAYESNDDDFNLLVSSICGISAHLLSLAVILKVQQSKGKVDLPPWNTVYLIFLPSMLAFVLNKKLLLFNTAMSLTALDLPIFARAFIQISIVGSNTEHGKDSFLMIQVILSHLVVNYILGKISEYKSWDKVENNMFSILLVDLYLVESEELYVVVLQKLVLSFGLVVIVLYGVSKVYQEDNLTRSFMLTSSWLLTFVSSALYQLNPILGGNSLVWLYEYVTKTSIRIKILSTWLLSLLFLIPTVFNYKIKLSPNARRKIWHFLILILVIYPLYLDPDFVKFSLAGALILFLSVELIRYLNLYPFGTFLDSHLREFADYRDDKGPVIISYLYLFIGISVPIFIDDSIAGLVALGVGDSLASIIGSNFGEIKWARSNKTVEGTATFILSTYAVSSGLKWMGMFFPDKSYHSLLLTSTLSGVLEGNSDLNDNILIPAYMVVLLKTLS